jgi:hypothetical protein
MSYDNLLAEGYLYCLAAVPRDSFVQTVEKCHCSSFNSCLFHVPSVQSKALKLHHMRFGYKVPGIILLQASYLYTYSLLRWVTLEVLSLSSYALTPTMLPLLENIFQTPVVE